MTSSTSKKPFVAPGDDPADAFISDYLEQKIPGIKDRALAYMEAARQAGDQPVSTNPLGTMLQAVQQLKKPDMPYEDFVTKLRERAHAAMLKKDIKPYSVDVGPTKVVGPAANVPLRLATELVKGITSPLWDGTVGTMRAAAAPLMDLPENQDPAQREAVRRGLMPPISDAERRAGQVQVLQGLLGVGAAGQAGAEMGMAKAGVSHATGLAGFVKNVVEGSGWGAMFGMAHGAGQEEAADSILNETKQGAVMGAVLGAGLGTVARVGGAAAEKYKNWKLSKLLDSMDSEQNAVAAHGVEMKTPDALKSLLPDGGIVSPPAGPGLLPKNTIRFENVAVPDNVREMLDPEKVAFLQRADQLLGEKKLHLDYSTGEVTALPDQRQTPINPQALPAEGTPIAAHSAKLEHLANRPVENGGSVIHQLDPEREVSYRLAYGDRTFFDKAAEYDLLPQEAKGKIDFWTYLDKTEGTGAAKFMRTLEKSAKTRIMLRGKANANTLFDVTAASLQGAHDLTDTAVIGAAKLYRLAHLAPDVAAKVWKNEMTQLLGDTPATAAALTRVYTNSQKQLEKMTANMAPEMRDVRLLMQKFEQGKAGMDWYTNARQELNTLFGPEDGQLMAGLLAIHSTGTPVDANTTMALNDFARLKSGQPPKGGRFPGNQVPMIQKLLAGQPFGDQKVQNFYQTLLGVSGHATNDVQVSRALGWARESFSKNQYRFVDEVIRGLAHDRGVTPEQYQAGLWTTPKIEKAQIQGATGKQMGSFRTYPELIKLKRAAAGIENTLKVPSEQGGGGYTFNPITMDAWKGKGYLATLHSDVVPAKQITPGRILQFIDKTRDIIKQHSSDGRQFTVGLWKQPDGSVSIDLNLVAADKNTALAIAKGTDQFAVGDMSTGSYEGDISTGKPPESPQRKTTLPEVRKILQETLGAKPKLAVRTPFRKSS